MKTSLLRLIVPAIFAATLAAVADEPAAAAPDKPAPPPKEAASEPPPPPPEGAERPEGWKKGPRPEGWKKGPRPEGWKKGPPGGNPGKWGKPGDGPRGPHREMGPRNVSILIDCSAQQSARFEHMRMAAIAEVERLAPTDIVSVVSFDGTASVIVPAQEVGDRAAIIEKIKELKPAGDSALPAAIAAGADEVRKNIDKNYFNAVIFFGGLNGNVGPSDGNDIRTLRESLGKEKIRLFPGGFMMRHPNGGPDGQRHPNGKGPKGRPPWQKPQGEAPAAAPDGAPAAAPAEP